MEDILVSVICLVYNHEKYLRDSLEGIVKQQTSFKFEALVHDDASTDKSAEIIKEYETKYPNVIKAIYQKENQFSQGIGIYKRFIYPNARGKYYAICEGDDCWIDNHKLAKQVEYMETHPDCTFCFTNAVIRNIQNGKKRIFIPYIKEDAQYLTKSGEYNLGQLAKLSFLPYASFLYPAKNREKYPDDYNQICWGGDRKTALYATAVGYAYFIDEPTCCYNYGVAGSAMTKNKSKKQVAQIERSFIDLNNRINHFSGYKYSDVFKDENIKYLKNIYMLTSDKSLFSEEEFKLIKETERFGDIIRRLILRFLPDKVFNFIRGIKRRMTV